MQKALQPEPWVRVPGDRRPEDTEAGSAGPARGRAPCAGSCGAVAGESRVPPRHPVHPAPTLVHAARGSGAASSPLSAGPRRALESEERERLRHVGFPPALRDRGHARSRSGAVT